jgi:hypothetical protein
MLKKKGQRLKIIKAGLQEDAARCQSYKTCFFFVTDEEAK